jgi:hypothetical protein
MIWRPGRNEMKNEMRSLWPFNFEQKGFSSGRLQSVWQKGFIHCAVGWMAIGDYISCRKERCFWFWTKTNADEKPDYYTFFKSHPSSWWCEIEAFSRSQEYYSKTWTISNISSITRNSKMMKIYFNSKVVAFSTVNFVDYCYLKTSCQTVIAALDVLPSSFLTFSVHFMQLKVYRLLKTRRLLLRYSDSAKWIFYPSIDFS